jgi:rare lipoprotein A
MSSTRTVAGGWARAAAVATLLALAACASAPRREHPAPAPPPAPLPPAPLPPPDTGAVADATPRIEPRSTHGNPSFYDVNGRRYQVLASAGGYLERGVASWYGPDFHGHNTSSGEPYDMYAMTAAHPTLPLPCYARITNLSNGRSIVVRINDRGPFVANRIVDLSYSAALRLDMVRTGTALVELRTVDPTTDRGAPLATSTPGTAPLYIQVGAYADNGNAQRVLARLRGAGIITAFALSNEAGEHRLHRIRVGPVATVEQFDALAARLATLGFPGARLATD